MSFTSLPRLVFFILTSPALVSCKPGLVDPGDYLPLKDDCDKFPFFEEPAWRDFADEAKLRTYHSPGWTDYALRVETPKLSGFLSSRGDRCLEGGGAKREFTLRVGLEDPDGHEETVYYQCQYGSLR